jgi:hypothetical protein
MRCFIMLHFFIFSTRLTVFQLNSVFFILFSRQHFAAVKFEKSMERTLFIILFFQDSVVSCHYPSCQTTSGEVFNPFFWKCHNMILKTVGLNRFETLRNCLIITVLFLEKRQIRLVESLIMKFKVNYSE